MENVKELINVITELKEMEDIIGFDILGTEIKNPVMDTTGRFEVEPLEEYGKININHFIEENLKEYKYIVIDYAELNINNHKLDSDFITTLRDTRELLDFLEKFSSTKKVSFSLDMLLYESIGELLESYEYKLILLKEEIPLSFKFEPCDINYIEDENY